MRNLVIRADAGSRIGSGHVMRCLGLAENFTSAGFDVAFAASQESFKSVAALNDSSLERLVLTDAQEEESVALVRRWPNGVDLLLVDHYERDAAFERACRSWARKIVIVDDLANRPHDGDVLIDGVNRAGDYRRLVPTSCRRLCGPHYALINSRFPAARANALARRDGRPVGRVLVTFGQVDAPNMTMRALEALRAIEFDGEIDIAIGAAAPHLPEIRAAAGDRVRLHVDASALDLLMTSADLAIGAGGVTSWERCCLGLPSVVTIIADNQRTQVSTIAGAAACLAVGEPRPGIEDEIAHALRRLSGDAELRVRMARAAANLIDGRGPVRLIEAAT